MALTPSDISLPFHVDVPVEAQQYLHDLVTWRPPESMVNVMGLVGFIALLYLVGWWMNRPRPIRMGEDEMTAKSFRSARVKFIVAEGVTAFVEEAAYKKKLTAFEVNEIYYKIGKAFGLIDLLPKRKPKEKLSRGEQEYLKEKIKDRSPNVVRLKPKQLGKNMLKKSA